MAFAMHVEKTSLKGGKTKQGTKMNSLTKLNGHNKRTGKYAQADNIDSSLTKTNYTLDDFSESMSYKKRVSEVVKNAQLKKKPRENSAIVASFVISASHEEMQGMTQDEQRKYFELVKEYLDNEFGESQLIYAEVHNDEETPHMHIGYVPLNDSETNVRWDHKINRESLRRWQTELPDLVEQAGFDVEKPTGKSDGHMSTQMYKGLEAREEALNARESDLKTREDDLSVLESTVQKKKIKVKKEAQRVVDYEEGVKQREVAVKTHEDELLALQNTLAKQKEVLEERRQELEERRKTMIAMNNRFMTALATINAMSGESAKSKFGYNVMSGDQGFRALFYDRVNEQAARERDLSKDERTLKALKKMKQADDELEL